MHEVLKHRLHFAHPHRRFFASAGPTCRKRLDVVVAGEARSANRAQWSNRSPSGNVASPEDSEDYYKSRPAEEVWTTAERLQPDFHVIDKVIAGNTSRVQSAFARAQVGPHHFQGSTGYGHGDLGRAALDQIMAEIMGTEAAIVRMQFVSGTHAISTALFACLRPGDHMLAVAGRPYDTLEEVIGLRATDAGGSLKEWGIAYSEVPLLGSGTVDVDGLIHHLQHNGVRVALIQRSCGYSLRPTLTIKEIARLVKVIKGVKPECFVLVDNCYGEFTEDNEPGMAGADLCMGSLIKSPGGSLVTGGGYIAGNKHLVAQAGARLTAPGIGLDSGAVPGETTRLMFQGLYMAPQMVGEALKGGRLVGEVFSRRGYEVFPPAVKEGAERNPSFITAIKLGSSKAMQSFCSALQQKSPVGSYVRPVPGQTSGYSTPVIFADGTFIDGSTSEMSADGPIREPFIIYCQGGNHWTQWATALESILAVIDQELPQRT